jgi:hypothetical protein
MINNSGVVLLTHLLLNYALIFNFRTKKFLLHMGLDLMLMEWPGKLKSIRVCQLHFLLSMINMHGRKICLTDDAVPVDHLLGQRYPVVNLLRLAFEILQGTYLYF